MTTLDTTNNTTNLTAAKNTDGWYVDDTAGSRWWPDDEAADEIEASDDPAATAIRVCETQPQRGRWSW